MKHISTKDICYTGLGIALYVALSLVIQVPVFENYYICLGYVVMLVYCYLFGPISGALVGGIGCLLYCLLTNGLRGMPGWTLGNIFIGITLGIWFKYIKGFKDKRMRVIHNLATFAVIIAATAGAMLIIKSLVESFLYAQPFLIRTVKNAYAFLSDTVVLIASLPLCSKRLEKFVRV